MTNLDFITSLVKSAEETQKKYGVFASVTIVQAIIESAWGKSKLVQTDKNLFGIKISGSHGVPVTKGTWATDDGGYYAHYNSVADSIDDHGYFLKHNSRYPQGGVFTCSSGKEQLRRIMNCGYASSGYYETGVQIIDQYNLQQYDTLLETHTFNCSAVGLQRELNYQGFLDKNGCTLMEDGIIGELTISALPVLRKGAQGNITKYLQSCLGISVDGIFGQATESTVKKFQSAHNLLVDGIVGKNTWRCLLNG